MICCELKQTVFSGGHVGVMAVQNHYCLSTTSVFPLAFLLGGGGSHAASKPD